MKGGVSKAKDDSSSLLVYTLIAQSYHLLWTQSDTSMKFVNLSSSAFSNGWLLRALAPLFWCVANNGSTMLSRIKSKTSTVFSRTK